MHARPAHHPWEYSFTKLPRLELAVWARLNMKSSCFILQSSCNYKPMLPGRQFLSLDFKK